MVIGQTSTRRCLNHLEALRVDCVASASMALEVRATRRRQCDTHPHWPPYLAVATCARRCSAPTADVTHWHVRNYLLLRLYSTQSRRRCCKYQRKHSRPLPEHRSSWRAPPLNRCASDHPGRATMDNTVSRRMHHRRLCSRHRRTPC